MNTSIRRFALLCLLPLSLLVANPAAADSPATPAPLYERLGGYNAITAVVDHLVAQLAADPKLGRFWAHRGEDGIAREKQLVVDFIVAKAGGPLYYRGREMALSHVGMKIDEQDWRIFSRALNHTLDHFKVPSRERKEVVGFMESLKPAIVEVH